MSEHCDERESWGKSELVTLVADRLPRLRRLEKEFLIKEGRITSWNTGITPLAPLVAPHTPWNLQHSRYTAYSSGLARDGRPLRYSAPSVKRLGRYYHWQRNKAVLPRRVPLSPVLSSHRDMPLTAYTVHSLAPEKPSYSWIKTTTTVEARQRFIHLRKRKHGQQASTMGVKLELRMPSRLGAGMKLVGGIRFR